MSAEKRAGLLILAAIEILMSGAPLVAQGPHARLCVLSAQGQTVDLVDLTTSHAVADIPVTPSAQNLVVSADGTTVYLSGDRPGTLSTVGILKLKEKALVGLVPLDRDAGPYAMTFVDGHLWIIGRKSGAVERYDPLTGKTDLILNTGLSGAESIYVAPGSRKIVVASAHSASVSVFDLHLNHVPPRAVSNLLSGGSVQNPGAPAPAEKAPPYPSPRLEWKHRIIAIGFEAASFAVSPDSREAWALNARDGTVSIIDLQSNLVTATLKDKFPGTQNLTFTPDGSRLVLLGSSEPDFIILDARSRTVAKSITIGCGAPNIAFAPDGSRAYAACTQTKDVAVVDMLLQAVVGRIPVEVRPGALALLPVPSGQP